MALVSHTMLKPPAGFEIIEADTRLHEISCLAKAFCWR
jgi:hypothetical protein